MARSGYIPLWERVVVRRFAIRRTFQSQPRLRSLRVIVAAAAIILLGLAASPARCGEQTPPENPPSAENKLTPAERTMMLDDWEQLSGSRPRCVPTASTTRRRPVVLKRRELCKLSVRREQPGIRRFAAAGGQEADLRPRSIQLVAGWNQRRLL